MSVAVVVPKTASPMLENTRKSVVIKVAAVLLAMLIVAFSVLSINKQAFADDDVESLSFYSLSSSLSSFSSNVQSPKDKDPFGSGSREEDSQWLSFMSKPGAAGSLLGYADSNRNDTNNWLMATLTAGSMSLNYESFDELPDGLRAYLYFGATLAGLGLDETRTPMGFNFIPTVGGNLLMSGAAASGSVSALFGLAITFLKFVNPFNLLYEGFKSIAPNFADAMISGDTNSIDNPIVASVAGFLSEIIRPLYNLSWGLTIPLFMAAAILTLLFRRSGGDPSKSAWSQIKKLLIRLVFIAFGIPLLGGLYTSALSAMEDATNNSANQPYDAINSMFVDFEGWAMNGNLAIPDGVVIEWDTNKRGPSNSSITSLTDTAEAVNKAYNVNSVCREYVGGFEACTGKKEVAEDLVARYTRGAMVNSSDYESKVKAQLTTLISSGSLDREEVNKWFELLINKNSDEVRKSADALNGNLVVNTTSGLSANIGSRYYSYSTSGSANCVGRSGFTNGTCNLAPLAMYNYLNTSFGSESFTVYSSKISTSGATRESHSSVNMVGSTSLVKFSNWMNTMMMFVALIIIGVFYAGSILFTSIKRLFQLISNVPFAMLGALSSIAKVIIYTFTFIIELIGTMFIYVLVQKILFALRDIPASLIAMTKGADALFGVGAFLIGPQGLLIFNIVTTLVIGTFTLAAVRLRKSVLKGFQEFITKEVNKFVGSSVGAPGGGGIGAKIGQAAGGAAGLASLSGMGGGLPGLGGNLPGGGDSPGEISVGEPGDGADGGVGVGVPGEGELGSAIGGLTSGQGVGGTTDGESNAVASDADIVSKGRDVGANGLSMVEDSGVPQDEMSALTDTVSSDMEQHAEADKKVIGAVPKAGMAVAKGFAGDYGGAVSDGVGAMQDIKSAQASRPDSKPSVSSGTSVSGGAQGGSLARGQSGAKNMSTSPTRQTVQAKRDVGIQREQTKRDVGIQRGQTKRNMGMQREQTKRDAGMQREQIKRERSATLAKQKQTSLPKKSGVSKAGLTPPKG